MCKTFNLPVLLFTKALISSTNVTNVDLNFLFEGEIIILGILEKFYQTTMFHSDIVKILTMLSVLSCGRCGYDGIHTDVENKYI